MPGSWTVAFHALAVGVAALVNVAGHFVVTMPSKSLAFTFAKAEAGVRESQRWRGADHQGGGFRQGLVDRVE